MTIQRHVPIVDVETLLEKLTLEEKIELLTGQGSFKTTGLAAHGIPSITVSYTKLALLDL